MTADGDAIADLIQYRLQIGDQIQQLRQQDEGFESVGQHVASLGERLKTCGGELVQPGVRRRKNSNPSSRTVSCRSSAWKGARFDVAFESVEEAGVTGFDRV